MRRRAGFRFFFDEDIITVKFVSPNELRRDNFGHRIAGDYKNRVIRLDATETWSGTVGSLFHEIGHAIVDRMDLRETNEEDLCEMLAWLDLILYDKRNVSLRKYLRLTYEEKKGTKRL